MRILNDVQPIDRAVLNHEIEAILQNPAGQEPSGNFPDRELVLNNVETLVTAGRRGELRQAAERVTALLSLDLDDLRKAALLSLMVRLTGKRKFDMVATYVLEKRATYVSQQS